MTKAEREVHRLRRRVRAFRMLEREAERRYRRFTLFFALEMLKTLEAEIINRPTSDAGTAPRVWSALPC